MWRNCKKVIRSIRLMLKAGAQNQTPNLTPMPRKCTICANRYKTAWAATKTAFFLRFARVTLTGRQFCGFLRKENKILIIIIIINLIKREARFAIFEIGKFFQGSLSYKNYVIRKAFQCASRIGAGRRNSFT